MNTHELKTTPSFLYDIASGLKPFEARKNDRDFQVGDTLHLKGYEDDHYTPQELQAEVTYRLDGGQFGIEPGHCVMGIKVLNFNF